MTYAASTSAVGSWTHPVRVCGRLVWNDCKQGLRKHLAGQTLREALAARGVD